MFSASTQEQTDYRWYLQDQPPPGDPNEPPPGDDPPPKPGGNESEDEKSEGEDQED